MPSLNSRRQFLKSLGLASSLLGLDCTALAEDSQRSFPHLGVTSTLNREHPYE